MSLFYPDGDLAGPLFSHSTALRGRGCHRAAKASCGENLQIEEPVGCGDASAFHVHATRPRMLGATLVRDEVVQVGESRQKCLLAPMEDNESLS